MYGCGNANRNGDVTEMTSYTDCVTTEEQITESITVTENAEIIIPKSDNLQFSPGIDGIYNYCPSVMEVGDGQRYIYYCTNRESYKVIDYIGCRKGSKDAEGNWTWSEETVVLSPGEGESWDAHHVCDPSVVAGEFSYNGESYSYLMAYLGCTSYDNQDNKIGIAVSKSPEGPFVKVGTSPFVDFKLEPELSVFQWGVGQPSLVNLDKKGNIVLFYTRGDKNGTRTIAEEWQLADLSHPVRVSSVKLSELGLKDLNSSPDIINNADAVYDSDNGVYYFTSDCHPNPKDVPDYISSHFRVTYFTEKSSFSSIRWETLETVGKKETGAERNHNTGILRNEYVHLPSTGYLTVYYTVSNVGDGSLWSYRIYDRNVKLPK